MLSDNDDNDETFELQAAVAAVFLHGILDAQECKASRHHSSRCAYLCQPQLLSNPRIGMPWQQLVGVVNRLLTFVYLLI